MTLKPVVKAIVPPLLWDIVRGCKQRLVPSTDRLAFAPRGWNTPMSGGFNEAYWNRFVERERAWCQALIARVRAGHETPFHIVLAGMVLVAGDYFRGGASLIPKRRAAQ